MWVSSSCRRLSSVRGKFGGSILPSSSEPSRVGVIVAIALLIGWPGKEAANIFSSMVCPYYFIFD
jgi:hypothetical protein